MPSVVFVKEGVSCDEKVISPEFRVQGSTIKATELPRLHKKHKVAKYTQVVVVRCGSSYCHYVGQVVACRKQIVLVRFAPQQGVTGPKKFLKSSLRKVLAKHIPMYQELSE